MAQYTFETLTYFDIANVVLPSGYTKLKYIQSGNSQYIDTGIIPTANTRIFMDATPINLDGGWRWFFGATTSTYNGIALYAKTNGAYSNYNNDISIGTLFSNNTRVIIDRNKNELYINNKLIRADNVLSITFTNKMFLLCRGQNDTPQGYLGAKLHLEEIYENDILVQKLIPCEDSNGNIGMYDAVTDTFFANQGINPFISGGVAPTYTFQNGDIIIISDEKKAYRYNNGELIFYYRIVDPLVFRGFTFEETVSKLTFSPLVFRGFSFEESPKIRNVSPLFIAGM